MVKLKTILIVALLLLVCAPVGAGTFVTESGRFVLGATDDMNLNPDGSFKPKPGVIGIYVYDLFVAKKTGETIRKIRFQKPENSNVLVMPVDGENALTEEGNYLLAVKIVNVIYVPGQGLQEFASPPQIVHDLVFDIPEPTPTPTPIPPEPTPTPVPQPDVPLPFVSDNQFFFVDETDFNETDFSARGLEMGLPVESKKAN